MKIRIYLGICFIIIFVFSIIGSTTTTPLTNYKLTANSTSGCSGYGGRQPATEACTYCASQYGYQTADYRSCFLGYTSEVKFASSGGSDENQVCFHTPTVLSSTCVDGWNAAKSKTQPGTPDAILQQEITYLCANYTATDYPSCQQGVTNAVKIPKDTKEQACSGASNQSVCQNAWQAEQTRINPTTATKDAQAACTSHKSNKNNYSACLIGYESGFGNAPDNSVCEQYNGSDKTVCQQAWTKGQDALNGSGSGGGSAPTKASCEDSSFGLAWAACAIINGTADFVQNIYTNVIQPLLIFHTDTLLDHNQPFYKVWSNFRLYGDIFLIIGLLVVVFGESIGGGVIEAYTIRKILPRLLTAAVLLNLSIYIVVLGIDLTNIVGQGVYSLILSPFSNINKGGGITLQLGGTGALAIDSVVAAGAIWLHFAGGIAHFLFTGILLPAVLIFIAILVTLLLRQTIIYLLLFLSPVAFALYCLPNTERAFRRWWDLLFRALIVYPIITALFAIANVMSFIMFNFFNGQPGHIQDFAKILGVAALIAPLLLIPFAFRLAGGIIGQIQQAAQSRITQPGIDFLKQVRQNRRQGAFKGIREGRKYATAPPGGVRDRLNRGLQNASLIGAAGANPLRMRRNILSARERINAQAAFEGIDQAAAFQPIKGNDDMLMASLHGRRTRADAREYLSARGYTGGNLEQALAHIDAARREMGSRNLSIAAAVSAAGTGTAYAGNGDMLATLVDVADGDMTIAGNMLAQARTRAEGARSFNLSGAGFGDQYRQLQAINRASTVDRPEAIRHATEFLADRALDSLAPGAAVGGRPQSIRDLMPAMQRRLARSMEAVQDITNGRAELHTVENPDGSSRPLTLEEARRNAVQALASTSGLLQVAGSVNPENARTLADGLLNGEFRFINRDGSFTPSSDEPPITVAEAIRRARSIPEFAQMERQYMDERTAAASGRAQEAAAGNPPATPPA